MKGSWWCTWERWVGGMGPAEVGEDSHFTVKFLLNTTAFSVSRKSIDIEPCSWSSAFWKPCGGLKLIFLIQKNPILWLLKHTIYLIKKKHTIYISFHLTFHLENTNIFLSHTYVFMFLCTFLKEKKCFYRLGRENYMLAEYSR